MKQIFTIICVLLSGTLSAQNAYYSVRINAVAQKSPAQVKLDWQMPPAKTNGTITIHRKLQNTTGWGTAIAQLAGTTTSYTDNTATLGTPYEYRITKDDTTQPYGYIHAAIEKPAIHNRGAILLLVDSTFSDSCSAEIATLVKDLSGDGWEVIRKTFLRSETVANVKSYIVSTATANTNLSALYILGHIAVPYSGNIAPDGHTVANSGNNSHEGAWPADIYYGDINGTWTDNTLSITVSGNPLNHNIPGDGKFDQSLSPSNVELQVGRVDFWDMPAFAKTEVQLMKSYLNKAHQYKIGALAVNKRGLVDDNFKNMAEGFAGNGWRNFAPLVGNANVSEKDLIATLNTDFYQWAYGCGAGSYTSCSGVGTTANFAANNVKSIFTILFGSYFGDWNYKNNFLRAPLCANEPSLASFWAARPNWHLHHMALGETIGYSARLSQNNYSEYATPIPQFGTMVHIALMGDPSLRTEYVKPVPSITLANDTLEGATISWTASPEPNVTGYYVYRSKTEFGNYQLRSGLVTSTSFVDSFGTEGTYWYMVRATKLQTTPSGTYYNTSLGTTASGTFKYPKFDVGVSNMTALTSAQLYPNPAKETVSLHINTTQQSTAQVLITDLQGRTMLQTTMHLNSGSNTQELNIGNLPAGMYMVSIQSGTTIKTLKLAKTH